ncbi:hypothetical protein Tco_0836596 [Tanacetum coccineum]
MIGRMFRSDFIMIVDPGAKLVNGMVKHKDYLLRGPYHGNNSIFLLSCHGVRWQVQLGRVGPDRVAVIRPAWSKFMRRNVDQDNLPLQLEKRVYPPSGSQTVDLVLNHRKYKILVGNVPLENSQSILEIGLFHLMVFNESGEAVTASETYSSYVLRNAFFYLGRKPAGSTSKGGVDPNVKNSKAVQQLAKEWKTFNGLASNNLESPRYDYTHLVVVSFFIGLERNLD